MPPRTGRRYCLACKEELKLTKNGKYNKKFCSKKCSNTFQIGEKHSCYKQGKFIDPNGYVRILVEGKGKYQLEHRYLIEKLLGRKLRIGEIVHHIDGNKSNNNISNLLLMNDVGEHTKLHAIGKPVYKNRRFKVLVELPEPKIENEIISLLPEYRTYKTTKCLVCNKLFWHRKDYNTKTCSYKCTGNGKHRIFTNNINDIRNSLI